MVVALAAGSASFLSFSTQLSACPSQLSVITPSIGVPVCGRVFTSTFVCLSLSLFLPKSSLTEADSAATLVVTRPSAALVCRA